MRHKNKNLQKTENKELIKAERIARFLAKLPSEKLLRVVKTDEQIKQWVIQRQDNDWISKCFVAKITTSGDPLRPLLKAKEIDKWLYDFLWNSANFYFSLWDLIQFTRDEIREYFTKVVKIEFPFNSVLALFLEVMQIEEHNKYSHWLKPYHKVSRPDLIEAATLTRKSVWENTLVKTNPNKAARLDPDETAKLDQLLTSYPKNFLLKIVWGICLYHSKNNEQIKEKVDAVMRSVCKTADLHAVGCRKRESSTFQKYRSFEIRKGEIFYAKQYGGAYT